MLRPAVALTLLSLPLATPAFAGDAAEAAAAELLEARLKEQRPEDLAILRSVKGKNVVVVAGSMDHIEQVLAAARIPHTLVQPNEVAGLDLNADQIVMVNCPGVMPAAGVQRIERFVRAGGLLYTTDWALSNVVERAFPRTIAANGKSTGDHVTKVEVHGHHHDLMTNLLLRKSSQPEWWLEGGSYPIKILDPKRVEVLASSKQMKKEYGAAPVVVRFRHDDGEVIHVVSHFYRQVATTGPAVAAKDGIDEVQGLSEADKKAFKEGAGGGVKLGDVESSYAFQQMTSNLVVGKQKRNVELDRQYGYTPAKPVTIAGREARRGDRLKIIETKGDQVRVRDDRGNEALVPAAALEAR